VASRRQDDPEVVRREYADETGLTARKSIWARRTGPRVFDVVFDELVALEPRRVLEAGCGAGEFAERVAISGIDIVAVDQSERMVELTRARGVAAEVADVQDLPFADGEFDVSVANFMLYHVTDIHRALAELARVSGALVATTNGFDQLKEMWDAVGRNIEDRFQLFMREIGEELLRPHFAHVRMIDLPATVEMTSADMRRYIAHSVAHKHLADLVPEFEGTRTVTASTAVFVAS
jgi:ubiquinone/menaquinone biosynthesis C-methylase UbiE